MRIPIEPGKSPSSSIVDALEWKLRNVVEQLVRGLREGADVDAWKLLKANPELLQDSEAVVEVIYTEYANREQLGQRPDPEAYYERFPHLRERLARQFEFHQMLQDVPIAGIDAADPKGEKGLKAERTKRPRSEGSASSRAPVSTSDTTFFDKVALTPLADDDEEPFQILQEIGRGGMGIVYKAKQPRLDRLAALKMILAGPLANPDEAYRLRREAKSLARLHHPYIVQLFETGQMIGRPFLLMEFVEGQTLAQELLSGRSWSPTEAARLISQLAEAIHYAHEHKVIHRDLKPANIMLTADRTPKITDFGLAKLLGEGSVSTITASSGAVIGTPPYMSPEQTGTDPSEEITAATDVYALGAILYELLTGHPPFMGRNFLETAAMVRTQDPLDPLAVKKGLPRDLAAISLKCLAKKPAQRYASARDLADDLGRFLQGQPTLARPMPWWERAWLRLRRSSVVRASLPAYVLAASGIAYGTWSGGVRGPDERPSSAVSVRELSETRALLAQARQSQDIRNAAAAWRNGDVSSAQTILSNVPASTCAAHFAGGHLRRRVMAESSHWSLSQSALGQQRAARGEPNDFLMPAARGVAFREDGGLTVITASSQILTLDAHCEFRGIEQEHRPVHTRGPRISPKGDALAVFSDEAGLLLHRGNWKQAKGQPPGLRLNVLRFSPDGLRLGLAESQEGADAIRVWTLGTVNEPVYGAGLRTLDRVQVEECEDIAFSPQGDEMAISGSDGRVEVWRIGSSESNDEPERIRALQLPSGQSRFLTFLSHRRLVCAGSDSLRVIELADDAASREAAPWVIPLASCRRITAIAASLDGKTLAVAADGQIRIFFGGALQELYSLSEPTGEIACLAFSDDGLALASAGESADHQGEVHVWRACEPAGHPTQRLSFLFRPEDNDRVFGR